MITKRNPRISDIPDKQILAVVKYLGLKFVLKTHGKEGVNYLKEFWWAMTWDIMDAFYMFPENVVMAKLRKLVRSKKLSGCTCGCRGDFYIP